MSSIPGLEHLAEDGFEIIKYDVANPGESYVGHDGDAWQWDGLGPSAAKHIIIRKIEKPKQYRPFATAAEFEPHRDRWVRRSHAGRPDAKGCYKVCAYDNWGIFDRGSKISYEEMFNDGRQFDDGTPFGVEVAS